MSRGRRLIRWFANSVVTILLVVAAAVVVIETDWFKNWLRLKLVAGAANVLAGELKVGRLGGSLWTGVTLEDVQLVDATGAVVHADHIRVRYDPFQLARRRWIIDSVVLQRARVQVVETADGWNVMHLTRPRPKTGGQTTVEIRRLQLVDSTVTIDSRTAPARVLRGVHLDSSLSVARGAASMTFAKLQAYDETTGLTLKHMSGTASDNFRNFDVNFDAESPAMTLRGSAKGAMAGTTRVIDATVDTTHLDLAKLTGRPQLASDITGHLEARASLPPGGGPPRTTFSFNGPRTSAFGYTADRIEATGEWAGDVVKFRSRVAGYSARATVDGVVRLPRGRRSATFAGNGTFSGVDLRRLPARLKLPQLASTLSGRFKTSVDGARWDAYTKIAGGVVEGATIGAGTEASISAVNGLISYSAVGSARRVDLQRFGRTVPVPALAHDRFASNISGQFFVAGQTRTGAPHALVGGAILDESTVSGTTTPSLNALAYLAEQRLFVSARGIFEGLNEQTLGISGVPVAANGSVDGWFAIANLDMPLNEDNIEGSALVDLGPSRIREVDVTSAVIDAQLIERLLTVRNLSVQHEHASLEAAGAIGLREPLAPEGITLKGTITDQTFLEKLLGQPIRTAGTVDATITGTLQSPAAAGRATLNQVAYRDTVSALTTTASFNVEWPERDTERLAWKAETSSSFVKLGATEIQRLVATGAGGLREMSVDVQADQQARSVGIEGRLTFLPDARELLLRRLALTTGEMAWSLPQNQQAVIRYGTRRIDVRDLTLVRGAQQIAVAGGFDLEPGGDGTPARLNVSLKDVELADVNHAMLSTRQLTGRINGAVTITGHRQAPVVDGEIAIRDGLVQGVPYSSVQAKGRFADGIATVDALLDQAPGASLRAVGTIPTAAAAANASMDLKVTGGPVNLGLVQAFTAEVENVRGDASIDLRVTGSIGNPIVNGTTTVAGGAFDVKGTGAKYTGIETALEFKDSQMGIRHLQIGDATGDLLTATGGLDVRRGVANRAFDIHVKAHSFTVLDNAFGNAEVDADLRISGDLTAPVARGTISLESGRLEVANILERTGSKPYRTEAQPAPGTPQPQRTAVSPFDRADLQLQVRLPDNLVLRGRGLRLSSGGFGIGDMNIITGGSFDVTKRPGAELDVRGALEVVQGSYTFQGRRFEIERGSDVRFRTDDLTDPTININATREVSGVVAEVRLRGSARSPELTLSSRPPLDESDILSLIVFNQPVSTLGAAQQVNLGERAAALAAGAIASPLADSIGRALNLDIFEIQAPTSDEGTGSVLIGSQLGTRFLVGLRQQFGHSETSLLTLEYRVNRLLRFVTSIASGTLQAHATRRQDRGGVDLIFVIRY